MSGWLLDTNVASGLLPSRSDRKAIAFVSSKPSARLFLSIVTIAEIQLGIDTQARVERRQELQAWLDHDVCTAFQGRILPIDQGTLLVCLRLVRQRRKQGKTVPFPDALIAATALYHGLTVASRDDCPYKTAGCDVVNPWQA